jgi:spermidine synthase
LLAVAGVAAVVILLARLPVPLTAGGRLRVATAFAAVIIVALGTAGIAAVVPAAPAALYAFGRKIMSPDYEPKMLYVGEGMNSSIAVTEDQNGARYFHVSGKIEAGSYPVDMRLQRMLGHLPALIDAKPRSVLVVGFGAGVTAGTFVTYPGIERIVICEIEPLIPSKVAGYFLEENYNVLKDPRVEVVYDDARRFILTSNEKFDIITSDPIHPWVKGAASLYTREYFELVKRHLKPGGVVSQWVPLYESTIDVVKSEMATFFSVFPQGIAWVNDREDGGDVVMLGQLDPAPIDVDAITQRLDANPQAAASLRNVGFASAIDLISSYAARGPNLVGWLEGAAVNTDRDLRLQYLAGMGLNVADQNKIYSELTQARQLPDGLFVGSETNLAELRNAIDNAEPRASPRRPGR